MSLTLGLTGMDPATEAALKAAFLEANARLGGHWSLVPDAEAGHVVVDMDSMYGPMSWLRLHAAGRHVIGLTSAPRTQTDFRLGRPFDVEQLMQLLAEVARAAGIELQAAGEAPPAADATRDSAPPAEAAIATEAATAPAAAPEVEPVPDPAATSGSGNARHESAVPEAPTPTPTPTPASEAEAEAEPESAPALDPAPTAADEPAPHAAPAAVAATEAGRDLAAWLQPGALAGRVRCRGADGTVLLIDAGTDTWHGPTALKPVAGCFEGVIAADELERIDDATWLRESAAAGAPQPLSRLRWLGGLLAGKGELLPGFSASDRFQLNKWPQTEREYPRHFRIATQMMKGPATLSEIAQASGVPESDVADFVNANLATGFAEPVVEVPPVAEEPARARVGLLGRLRNR